MNQDTERSDSQKRIKDLHDRCDYMLDLLDKWEEADKKKSRSLFKRVFSLA